MTDLRHHLTAATDKLRNKPDIVRTCFEQVGYYQLITWMSVIEGYKHVLKQIP